MSLQISIREYGDVAILDLRGRATFDGGSQMLSSRLRELAASGVHKVLLNLKDLTQIDSSCFSIIFRSRVSFRQRNGDLGLLRPSGHVLEAFRLLRALEIIPSFEDETEALASFRPQVVLRTILTA